MSGNTIHKIGFIGTGIMGGPMAGHLMDAGYEVTVYNRTESKAMALVEKGALLAHTVADAARDMDLVITMVGYPEDVEETYLGSGGILENARKGAYLIDMTTSSPKLARDIHAAAEVNGQHAFDAPVTGGETAAISASLTIFCGASDETVAPVMDALKAMGTNILTFDEPGAGQMAKLANQTALAGAMLGMVEGLAFAKECKLNMDKILSALITGSAGSAALKNFGPKVLRGDYTPGFQVHHYIKDLNLVLATAEDLELTLPTADTAINLYGLLSEIGGGSMGTQGLSLVYADEETCSAAGLDWSRLNLDEEEDEDGESCGCGHDHGHGHEHEHEHGHEHGDSCSCGCHS